MKLLRNFIVWLPMVVWIINRAEETPYRVDLIAFSYDRPLQLYAFLESIETLVTGLASTTVIYRASNIHFEKGYEELKLRFCHVAFIAQEAPYADFKSATLNALCNSAGTHIIFGVDDIIVKDHINLTECANALERYHAYGFFLSLGTHLTYCYSMNKPQKVPPFASMGSIRQWRFNQGEYDWDYPHNLDMTVYRKNDLNYLLTTLDYKSPNRLEYELAINAPHDHIGICYQESKVLNFPLNIVQTDFENNHSNSYSTMSLLTLFNEGFKIDLKPLFKFRNNARHVDNGKLIQFIPRTKDTL